MRQLAKFNTENEDTKNMTNSEIDLILSSDFSAICMK